ncbi:MAG: T9SS type A sorting domain-containing protein, partial [Saprospiraceae bacterium]|nr:T9SS type A sorting domain-containing protein [Saprospiraceae bacterium]
SQGVGIGLGNGVGAGNGPGSIRPGGNLVVFPNPSTGQYYLQFEHAVDKPSRIIVQNLVGQYVQVTKFDYIAADPMLLDITELPDGMYTIMVEVDGVINSAHKVIKE